MSSPDTILSEKPIPSRCPARLTETVYDASNLYMKDNEDRAQRCGGLPGKVKPIILDFTCGSCFGGKDVALLISA